MEQNMVSIAVVVLFLFIYVPSIYAPIDTTPEECVKYCPKDCKSNFKEFNDCNVAKWNCDCNSNPPKPNRGSFAPTPPPTSPPPPAPPKESQTKKDDFGDKVLDTFKLTLIITFSVIGGIIVIGLIVGGIIFYKISKRNSQRNNFYGAPVVAPQPQPQPTGYVYA